MKFLYVWDGKMSSDRDQRDITAGTDGIWTDFDAGAFDRGQG